MPGNILEELVRQVMQSGSGQISFSWQGGEPTLMGLDFFRSAIELQKRFGRPGQFVSNSLQTNGLNLTEEWCAFLKQFHWLVGLSVDGPAFIHDRFRTSAKGAGSYERVMQAARLMLAEGVEFNALGVVTGHSSGLAREIFEHHVSNGIRHMQFIPCVMQDGPENMSVDGEAYGRFLCELFDLWRDSFIDGAPSVYIRNFEALLFTYTKHTPPDCVLMRECGTYLVVEHNGNAYSCDFHVDEEHCLGNLMHGKLKDFLNSPAQLEFGREKSRLPDRCVKCRKLKHCRGGCPKHRFQSTPGGRVSHLCEAYTMLLEHASAFMQRLASPVPSRGK